MTKVQVTPGPCGFTATVTAEKIDRRTVKITLDTQCAAYNKMMAALGDTFDVREVVLVRPGCGPFNKFASENFPVHVGCPVISAMTKCAEGEMGLALKRDVEIKFINE